MPHTPLPNPRPLAVLDPSAPFDILSASSVFLTHELRISLHILYQR